MEQLTESNHQSLFMYAIYATKCLNGEFGGRSDNLALQAWAWYYANKNGLMLPGEAEDYGIYSDIESEELAVWPSLARIGRQPEAAQAAIAPTLAAMAAARVKGLSKPIASMSQEEYDAATNHGAF